MSIKDYKGKRTYTTLGLKRGKAAIRHEASSVTPARIVMWIALFGLVVLVNYLIFTHLEPINKKGTKIAPAPKVHKKSDDFSQWFDKAYKRFQEGDLSGAAQAYTHAISIRPEEMKAYFNRGIVYSKMGMHDKAIKDYDKAIRLNPDYAEAYNNRGWVYLQKKLFDNAIRDCNQALALDTTLGTAYHTRGMAFRYKGLLDQAKDDFHQSCELGDSNGCVAYEKFFLNKK